MVAYLRLQIMLTKANSTREPKMNPVQPRNQISLALMYDTLGRVLPWEDAKVIKDNIVVVPGREKDIFLLLNNETAFGLCSHFISSSLLPSSPNVFLP